MRDERSIGVRSTARVLTLLWVLGCVSLLAGAVKVSAAEDGAVTANVADSTAEQGSVPADAKPVAAAPPVKIESRADQIEILKSIAADHERLYLGLRTFEGALRVKDTARLEGGHATEFLNDIGLPPDGVRDTILREATCDVRVALDIAGNRLHSEYQVQGLAVMDAEGQPIELPQQAEDGSRLDRMFWQRSIVREEDYVHLQPKMHYNDVEGVPNLNFQKGRVAFRDPRDRANGQEWGYVVDPRSFFRAGLPFWEEFQQLAKMLEVLDNPGDLKLDDAQRRMIEGAVEIWRRGSSERPTYHIDVHAYTRGAVAPTITRRWTVDTTASGLRVAALEELHRAEGSPKQITKQAWQWSWSEISGFEIPTSLVRFWPTDEGDHIRLQREVTVLSATINQPLDEAWFEYSSLGLESGDRLADRIERVCYDYQEGQLVNPVAFDAPATPAVAAPPAGVNRRLWLVGTNGLVVLGLLGFAAYRWRPGSRHA